MRHVSVTEGDKVSAQIRFGWEGNTFGSGDLAAKVNAQPKAKIADPRRTRRPTSISS